MELGTNSFMGQILAVIAGGIFGVIIHQLLSTAGWDMTIPSGEGTLSISGRDFVTFALGGLMIVFGGKINNVIRYAGAGVVAWQLGHEAKDFIWANP